MLERFWQNGLHLDVTIASDVPSTLLTSAKHVHMRRRHVFWMNLFTKLYPDCSQLLLPGCATASMLRLQGQRPPPETAARAFYEQQAPEDVQGYLSEPATPSAAPRNDPEVALHCGLQTADCADADALR